jgi:hypothetical protein
MDMPLYPGDPLTPGIGATPGAKRLPLLEAQTLTKIPVLPISYGDALPILRNLRGPIAPEAWRGALPITYCMGPGPAVVHLRVSSDWSLHPAYNVIARIEGNTFPDEWIIQGNHHDAWVNGAMDPVSGLISELEEARALGVMLKQGWQPKRTIILAAWDGEEPGLLGSTEWAEDHAAELGSNAVLYLNGDSNSKGWLGVGGSHSLERFMHEVALAVEDPQTGKSVYDALKERQLEKAKDEQERKKLRERTDLPIGALGSGSDYTAFIDHLGIASLNLGFAGEDGGGVYHSIYDSYYWYTHFGDTSFVYCRALSQLEGTAVMRLAGAPVLPFEFTDLATTIGKYVEDIETLAKKDAKVDLTALKTAQQNLMNSAQAFERSYQEAAAAGTIFMENTASLHALNKILYQSERTLISPDGLPHRPWFKHQIYAPGYYTGYGVKTLPFVREALEQKQWDEAGEGVQVVKQRLTALAAQLEAAAGSRCGSDGVAAVKIHSPMRGVLTPVVLGRRSGLRPPGCKLYEVLPLVRITSVITRRVEEANFFALEQANQQHARNESPDVSPESNTARILALAHAAAEQLQDKPESQNETCRNIDQSDEPTEKQQSQHPGARVKQNIGAKYPRNGTAGTYGRNGGRYIGQYMADRSQESREQIEDEVAKVSHRLFDVVAEDPQEPHVPNQVHPAAMEEHAREEAQRRRNHGNCGRQRLRTHDHGRNGSELVDKQLPAASSQRELVEEDQSVDGDQRDGDGGRHRSRIVVAQWKHRVCPRWTFSV